MGMASVADFDVCSGSEWQDFARAAKLKPVQERKMKRNIQSTIDAQLVAELLQDTRQHGGLAEPRSDVSSEDSWSRPGSSAL
jgi:hypothetical protein